ncbi:MAG: glycosyltransferase family 2 protein [Candidatus Promineifilaceae bacterium]|nr:glycosyltransferase family 2 protein [Candidatus Promineifilaceae bacterium]
MFDLAVVIVNYNVRDLLRRCLTSVFATEGEVRLRVCVVDNASEDGSVEMVRAEFPDALVIANRENVGYPSANNQGLRALGLIDPDPASRPRYALLLNPDTEVPANAFATLINHLDENPDIGVIGPKLVMPDGQLDLACRRSFPTPEIAFYRMTGLSRLFPGSRRFGRYNMTFLDEDETAEVDSVVGAFMMVRERAIARVGLLDERFWMYGEDLDWAKRIKAAGWRVVYYPEVQVLHVKRASSRQSKRAKVEFYRAMLIFYYKHYRNETVWPLHWLIVTGIALRGGRPLLEDVRLGATILQDG